MHLPHTASEPITLYTEAHDAALLSAIVEPPELRDLPVEVIQLVHAVDRMRDGWADGDDARRQYLWTEVHKANDAVWGRLDLREK